MRKSRNETVQTRERIVSTASQLFLEKGLGTVGMRDVMAGADLTGGGFYRHFQSKDQLVAEANSAAFNRLFAMLESEAAGKTPTKALDRIVSLYLGQQKVHQRKAAKRSNNDETAPYLCPLARLGAELSHADPQVQAVALDGYRRLVQLVAGPLQQIMNREALATASGIVSTMVGAVTLANLQSDPAAADAILNDAFALIRQQYPAEVRHSF